MTKRRTYRYELVDVFASVPLDEGNPLTVFADSVDLHTDAMQRIARELNLSETVFIAPSRRRDCRRAVAHLSRNKRKAWSARVPPEA